jgi:hypothetical protein
MCPFRCSAGCDLFISSLVEGSLLGKGEAWFLIIYLPQSMRSAKVISIPDVVPIGGRHVRDPRLNFPNSALA